MFLFNKKKEKRIWPYILLAFFMLSVLGGWRLARWIENLTPADIIDNKFVRDYVASQTGDKEKKKFELLPDLLGINEPKTYLVLFLNSTELRPGGGFIGSYAVATADKGAIEILKVEGTETLDKNTQEHWNPVPPAPIAEHLGVGKWYFRDSNWSPDFAESSKKSLEFYGAEGGLSAGRIDFVVGVTPTVLERLLQIIGPITVDGITFTAEDVTEKLEYEVEYGFADNNLNHSERKRIMEPFAAAVLAGIKRTLLANFNEYSDLADNLIEEKQILFYATRADLQKKLAELNLTGAVLYPPGDYLMWIDANLAALKTDWAVKRSLIYSFTKNEAGELIARASMKYEHQGKFDWRTTRYRAYARVFVPQGSELIGVEGAMETDRSGASGTVDMGLELDKQWFGAFIAIEPGDAGILTFSYILPDSVSEQAERGLYTLFVQKQSGTNGHRLTLDLNFGKTISVAEPPEKQEEWGDGIYKLQSDLRVDRSFNVALE